jgi:hypothetical protein
MFDFVFIDTKKPLWTFVRRGYILFLIFELSSFSISPDRFKG